MNLWSKKKTTPDHLYFVEFQSTLSHYEAALIKGRNGSHCLCVLLIASG
jgi:hypothetical protein